MIVLGQQTLVGINRIGAGVDGRGMGFAGGCFVNDVERRQNEMSTVFCTCYHCIHSKSGKE